MSLPGRLRARRGSHWERWGGDDPDAVEVFLAREPDASFHLHWHEEWSLGAIQAGRCSFSCGGRRAVARRGDVVLLPPRAVHTAGTSTARFEMVMLYLPVRAVARRLALDPETVPVLDSNVWRCSVAADGLRRAARERRLDEVFGVLAGALASCRAPSGAVAPLGPVDGRVARISALLRAHPDQLPDVRALASAVGLSREHLHRLFHAALGLTPGQYLRLCRVDLAKRLLRKGARVADAAQACGFADQAHFSRWFRRYLGVTPRQFASERGR